MHASTNFHRRMQWVVANGAAHSTAAAAAAVQPPPRVVAGHGLHAETVADAEGREALVLCTTLGEVLRTAEQETASPAWTAFVHALCGVRCVRLTNIGPACVLRIVNVDTAAVARLALPPGARRYGDAAYNGVAPGGAVVVQQFGVPGQPHWGYIVTGGPTVALVRSVAVAGHGDGDDVVAEAYRGDERVILTAVGADADADGAAVDRVVVLNPRGIDPVRVRMHCPDGTLVWSRTVRGGAPRVELEL